MTIIRTIVLIVLTSFFCYGQNDGEEVYLELKTFELNDPPDSVTCERYAMLKANISDFNHNQINRATSIADSLSKMEYPCYEFIVAEECYWRLENLVEKPIDCHFMSSSWDNECVNSTIRIYKRRRFKTLSDSSRTIFCPEDSIRN